MLNLTSDLRAPMRAEQKTRFLNWMQDVQILHVYYMKHKAGFLNRDARCRNSTCIYILHETVLGLDILNFYLCDICCIIIDAESVFLFHSRRHVSWRRGDAAA